MVDDDEGQVSYRSQCRRPKQAVMTAAFSLGLACRNYEGANREIDRAPSIVQGEKRKESERIVLKHENDAMEKRQGQVKTRSGAGGC